MLFLILILSPRRIDAQRSLPGNRTMPISRWYFVLRSLKDLLLLRSWNEPTETLLASLLQVLVWRRIEVVFVFVPFTQVSTWILALWISVHCKKGHAKGSTKKTSAQTWSRRGLLHWSFFSNIPFHVSHLAFLKLERPYDSGQWFSNWAVHWNYLGRFESYQCLGCTSRYPV